MNSAPVMILAGGTGGHIFPGLAVAAALRARGIEVVWLGADGGMETRLVPQHGIAIDTLPTALNRLPRFVSSPWNSIDVSKPPMAASTSLRTAKLPP
jgi:UDP-N-acetylglucosamine:LPS N-acetylglucosamine transferase